MPVAIRSEGEPRPGDAIIVSTVIGESGRPFLNVKQLLVPATHEAGIPVTVDHLIVEEVDGPLSIMIRD